LHVQELAAQKVVDASDFAWQAQLRSYWESSANTTGSEHEYSAKMKMMSAVLDYGYEYLGNSSRLVVTPLTDRCYRCAACNIGHHAQTAEWAEHAIL
jgi:dynein heavy chain